MAGTWSSVRQARCPDQTHRHRSTCSGAEQAWRSDDNYTDRARVTAMLAELSGGKAGVESLLMEGQLGPVITAAEVGLNSPTELCPRLTLTTYIRPGERRVKMYCGGKGSAAVELWYSSNGGWTCNAVSLVNPYTWAPEGCNAGFNEHP